MKLRSIDYDDNEDPAKVTVALTIAEAAFVLKVIGDMNGIQSAGVMPGGDAIGSEVYLGLVSVFNGHWDGGLGDYLDGRTDA